MKAVASEERATLVRYLLGELPQATRESIEERYMLDNHYGELLDEVETDLVDGYVDGDLTPLQRRQFESRYLITAERKASVQAAYLSKVYRDRIVEPESHAVPFVPKMLPRWPNAINQLALALAASLAIAVVGGSAWFLFDRWNAKPEVRSVAQNAPAKPAPSTEPKPVQPTPTPLPKQANPRTSRGVTEANHKKVQTVVPKVRAVVPQVSMPAAPQVDASSAPELDARLELPLPVAPPLKATASAHPTISNPHGPTTSNPHPTTTAPAPNMFAHIPAAAAPPAPAQDSPNLLTIQQTIDAKYALTVATPDLKEIIKPGATLVLKINNLTVTDIEAPSYYQNIYRNGNIERDGFAASPHNADSPSAFVKHGAPVVRELAAGERLWVTAIDVSYEGIVFHLLTDPFQGRRYMTTLKFPFPQWPPRPGAVAAVLSEVFPAQPAENDSRSQATPVISAGDTVAQVIANLGSPKTIIVLGNKKIYFYSDMKVTFVDGKVTDIQ